MILRRPEILSYREDVHLTLRQVAKYLKQLFHGLADSDHDSSLGNHSRRKLLNVFQEPERAFIAGAGAHRSVQARYRLGIVIENLGMRFENRFQAIVVSLKVWNQNFNLATGSLAPNLANSLGEDLCSAHVVVVPVHAGDDRMFQP